MGYGTRFVNLRQMRVTIHAADKVEVQCRVSINKLLCYLPRYLDYISKGDISG